MIQYVFILGATGKVGSEVVRQIIANEDWDGLQHANPTIIVGVASSSQFLFSPQGLAHDTALAFSKRLAQGTPYSSLKDLLLEVKNDPALYPGKGNRLIFVDATATDTLSFHKEVMHIPRYGIVTANKIPLANADLNTFQKLTSNVHRYGFRCSVMAGADAISILQDFRDVGDPVKEFYGCFSGTLGFVCSELQGGKPFSDIVRDACEKGYTEPHPRDDLNGVDVARKLLIMARTAGYLLSMENIVLTPFIPKEYLDEGDVSTFLDKIQNLNSHFADRIERLKKEKKVLRFVARVSLNGKEICAKVGIEEVGIDSPLGVLKGPANKIVIVTETYKGDMPYCIEVPGAGLCVTAQNIRRDLLHQLQDRKINLVAKSKTS